MTHPQPNPADPTLFSGPEFNFPSAAAAAFAAAQADSILMEEIRILRERGLTDECIHSLFSGFNIDAHTESSGQHWKLPTNDQLIRLIWGKALPSSFHFD